MIEWTEKLGYQDALVNIGGGLQKKILSVRNNKRVMVDSWPVANFIFQRVKKFIPEKFRNLKVISLNER